MFSNKEDTNFLQTYTSESIFRHHLSASQDIISIGTWKSKKKETWAAGYDADNILSDIFDRNEIFKDKSNLIKWLHKNCGHPLISITN